MKKKEADVFKIKGGNKRNIVMSVHLVFHSPEHGFCVALKKPRKIMENKHVKKKKRHWRRQLMSFGGMLPSRCRNFCGSVTP